MWANVLVLFSIGITGGMFFLGYKLVQKAVKSK